MSDTPQGPGWWQASDTKWYPPESFPAPSPAPDLTATPYPQPGSAPYGQTYEQPYQQPYGQQYGQQYAPVPTMPKTEPMAIISLVCALAGTVFAFMCGVGLIATIAAIPLGFVARRKIRDSNGMLTGDGMALAGAIIGIVATVGVILLWGLYILAVIGSSNNN
jgi:hypothetical protein